MLEACRNVMMVTSGRGRAPRWPSGAAPGRAAARGMWPGAGSTVAVRSSAGAGGRAGLVAGGGLHGGRQEQRRGGRPRGASGRGRAPRSSAGAGGRAGLVAGGGLHGGRQEQRRGGRPRGASGRGRAPRSSAGAGGRAGLVAGGGLHGGRQEQRRGGRPRGASGRGRAPRSSAGAGGRAGLVAGGGLHGGRQEQRRGGRPRGASGRGRAPRWPSGAAPGRAAARPRRRAAAARAASRRARAARHQRRQSTLWCRPSNVTAVSAAYNKSNKPSPHPYLRPKKNNRSTNKLITSEARGPRSPAVERQRPVHAAALVRGAARAHAHGAQFQRRLMYNVISSFTDITSEARGPRSPAVERQRPVHAAALVRGAARAHAHGAQFQRRLMYNVISSFTDITSEARGPRSPAVERQRPVHAAALVRGAARAHAHGAQFQARLAAKRPTFPRIRSSARTNITS
ncbi:hypothetical protein ACJJTC_012939 [Scirpophaga incertulas]